MKSALLFSSVLAAFLCLTVAERMQCKLPPTNVPTEWKTMVKSCNQKMRDQVQEELNAAMTYLAMGAHFSRDNINRPGFAKMFYESASEEREHAIKIMEYLLMRGELTSSVSELINDPHPVATTWDTGVDALKAALKLETHVTTKIMDIIKECETPTEGNIPTNDYHLVDYLTADFLEEQYRGQKDLANKISTLEKMMKSHGNLGEWLFDKKLLKGEIL